VGLVTIVLTLCLLKGHANLHYLQASGAVVVASSHVLNRRLCRTCQVCERRDGRKRSTPVLHWPHRLGLAGLQREREL
jgi:hypothetical protein